MMKHSKLPFRFDESSGDCTIYDVDGCKVACAAEVWDDCVIGVDEDDAEFIVKACNEYYELKDFYEQFSKLGKGEKVELYGTATKSCTEVGDRRNGYMAATHFWEEWNGTEWVKKHNREEK
ncbi:MAG: hypothetical protein GY861_15540 [bacterium]|nr:hypothetical protein [bacterium]